MMKISPRFLTPCLLFFLALAVQWPARAEEKDVTRAEVPTPVLAAFESAYPKAKIVGYSREIEDGKTYFEVKSKEGTMTRDVLYHPDGTLVLFEESLTAGDLPKPVADALRANHPAARVLLAERLEEGKTIQYEVLLKQGDEEIEVKFEPDGTIVK